MGVKQVVIALDEESVIMNEAYAPVSKVSLVTDANTNMSFSKNSKDARRENEGTTEEIKRGFKK
jgi:hypothetical protein